MTNRLDLSTLTKVIASLREALKLVGNDAWFSTLPTMHRNVLIAGVIRNFEFVHELSAKMIRRRIECVSFITE